MTLLPTRVELWPVSADRLGVWLVEPDAWRSGPLEVDQEPHQAITNLLRDRPGPDTDALACCRVLHSTSWRVDHDYRGNMILLSYVAVMGGWGSHEYVRDVWPQALPLSLELIEEVGKPYVVQPTAPPIPRYFDVMAHAVRHLVFLRDYDAMVRAQLDDYWLAHLDRLTPSLSGMYLPAA